MGVREIERSLERWELGVKDLQRRMILAPTPRERERWYAMLLLAQGWTAAATAEALDRDPHTIGRWASAFGEGGSRALMPHLRRGPPAVPQAQQLPELATGWERRRTGEQTRIPTLNDIRADDVPWRL